MRSRSRTTTASARHDRAEELDHLVGGSAWHGEIGVIADLGEVVAHILNRERGAIETFVRPMKNRATFPPPTV